MEAKINIVETLRISRKERSYILPLVVNAS